MSTERHEEGLIELTVGISDADPMPVLGNRLLTRRRRSRSRRNNRLVRAKPMPAVVWIPPATPHGPLAGPASGRRDQHFLGGPGRGGYAAIGQGRHQTISSEFVINLQTAKLLSIEVPETLLATADEVIQ
jgi:hypothetical protein